MTLVTDISSGVSKSRKLQIQKEARTALLGDIVNFLISEMGDVFGKPDLGDEYRSPIKTDVPTLFVSGVLDNNTQPFQADDVRKILKTAPTSSSTRRATKACSLTHKFNKQWLNS